MKLKKFLCTLLTVLLITSSMTTVMASNDVTVILDGKQISFDVAPRLIGGRTMVPLRAIFEALGATVSWDDPTQTVTAYNEVNIVKCTIDSNTMYVNNVAKIIDVPPMLVESRTLVPARFIAESFGCTVEWNPDTFVVSITSADIDYSQVEKSDYSSTTHSSQVVNSIAGKGTLANPYSASDGATVVYHEWTFEPIRKVSIACKNVIRGTSANSLANSENRYNDKPDSNQEWIFFEFIVMYISSNGGPDDALKGSDVIYKDLLFTTSGSAIPVHDTATLGNKYKGYGVFDVELYPGANSKVVLGVLTDKGIGDILLKVPNKGESTNTWINCTNGVGSSISSSISSSSNSSGGLTNTNITPSKNSISYYPGTTLPTYTSLTGVALKQTHTFEDGAKAYIYDATDANTYASYVSGLLAYGWSEYKHENKDGRLSYYMIKGSDLISVVFAAKFSQIWILPGK